MRFNIVKQSDVSFGTALHYALNWTYGRKALCGKEMRSTARDGEIEYKRVCGSCLKIMATLVEKAHAEALRELTFQAGDTVQYTGTGAEDDPTTVGVVESVDGDKLMVRWDDGDLDEMYAGRLVHFTRGDCDVAVEQKIETEAAKVAKVVKTLTPPMITALVSFYRSGLWDDVHPGTVCALLDRELVGHSRKGIHPNLLTDLGRAVLAMLGWSAVAEPPVLRLLNIRTGLVRRVLGTSLTTNAPHKTIVWVQREGEQGAQAWSADELMSQWHDLVAIDENDRTNEDAARFAALNAADLDEVFVTALSPGQSFSADGGKTWHELDRVHAGHGGTTVTARDGQQIDLSGNTPVLTRVRG